MTKQTLADKLRELFELYKDGTLSEEEYNQLKSELMGKDRESEKPLIENKKSKKEETVHLEEEDNRHEEIKQPSSESGNRKEAPVEKQPEPAESDHKTTPKKEKKKSRTRIVLASIVAAVAAIAVILYYPNMKTNTIQEENKEEFVKDSDGNIYQTVILGQQTWFAENLRTTTYKDGTPIVNVSDGEIWRNLTTPAYCWYENNEAEYKSTYGALYNWYAVETDKLCPDGWHVPTASDWEILADYLINNNYGHTGRGEDIGKSLASKSGWQDSDVSGSAGSVQASNNRTGFNALPGGIRFSNGEFRHKGENAKWWSASESSGSSAQIRFLSWNDGLLTSYSNRKENGFSVRCVKNSKEVMSASKPPEAESRSEAYSSASDPSYRDEKHGKPRLANWNEEAASQLVMNHLKNDTSYWFDDYLNGDDMEIYRDVNFIGFTHNNTEYKVAAVFSQTKDCPACGFIASVFEFRKINEQWYLNNVAKGILRSDEVKDVNFFPLDPENYGIRMKGFQSNTRVAGGVYTFISIFAFFSDGLHEIFNESIEGWDDEYDMNCQLLSFNNKTYLEIEKIAEGSSATEYFEFNGRTFNEYHGSFTDPSLTSIERMGFREHFDAKERGVCPRCNGTGVEVCPLCNGTGVTDMGIECNCVRTYKMEMAAGHTPGHPPKRWTCTRCGGTGEY
mgnify:CR=1 FL=1